MKGIQYCTWNLEIDTHRTAMRSNKKWRDAMHAFAKNTKHTQVNKHETAQVPPFGGYKNAIASCVAGLCRCYIQTHSTKKNIIMQLRGAVDNQCLAITNPGPLRNTFCTVCTPLDVQRNRDAGRPAWCGKHGRLVQGKPR